MDCINDNLNNKTLDKSSLEDAIDFEFIQRVQNEVTVSCALPLSIPVDRIPSFILQAAQWFWQNADDCIEERMYYIKNEDICKNTRLNKIICLPPRILSIQGVYKVNSFFKYGAMGDFSVERMLLSSYNILGGAGVVGNGMTNAGGIGGWNLTDVTFALYEVDTFNQTLNYPISYNYNMFSHKLVLLGNNNNSDLVINTWVRSKIQDLYNNYYFFRFVVCLVKKSLSTIYGTYEFKLPGGVTINYSNFSDSADTELDEIKEWVKNNRAADIILMPNVI